MSTTAKTKAGSNYKTSDLYYAAYLQVAGVPFVGTHREDNRVYFLFEETDGMSDLRTQYFNRIAKVPAMSYADQIKAFKALVHNP